MVPSYGTESETYLFNQSQCAKSLLNQSECLDMAWSLHGMVTARHGHCTAWSLHGTPLHGHCTVTAQHGYQTAWPIKHGMVTAPALSHHMAQTIP